MRRVLNYTLAEKAFQLATSMALVLVAARALSHEQYLSWTTGLGLFLGFAPLLALMPNEVLVRHLDGLGGRFAAVRTLLISVLGRLAIAGLAGAIALAALWGPSQGQADALQVALLLLALTAVSETLGFAVALSLRLGDFGALLRGRFLALALKLALTSTLLLQAQPSLMWVCLVFVSDSLAFALWNWRQLARATQLRLRATARYLSRRHLPAILGHALHVLLLSLPAAAILSLYNFGLRSDRLFLAQLGLIDMLQAQAACMQFIDPVYLLFCGYLINLFLHGGRLDHATRLRWMGALIACAAVLSALGGLALSWAPRNLAIVAPWFKYLAWYVPAYGGFAMLFLGGFYGRGTRAAARRGLGFLVLAYAVALGLSLLPNQPVYWTGPILAGLTVLWIAATKG